MAIPSKGRRIIIVNKIPYYWLVKQSDDLLWKEGEAIMGLSLVIHAVELPKGKLLVHIDGKLLDSYYRMSDTLDVSITPSLVRRVIRYAIEQGWNPHTHPNMTIPDANTIFGLC